MRSILDMKSAATLGTLTAAEAANQLVQKLGIAQDKEAAFVEQFKNLAAQEGVAVAIEQTVANYGLATSQMAVLWPILLVVAAIGALVAIVWGAVAAYDALTQSEEEAYERSKQAAEELQKSADDAKDAADKLASAFDNYDSAVDKLEECTKGTEEWKKALEDVNEAALEVIDNLPDDISAADLDALYDRDKKTG
jgi:DNA repair exonuclease SbcCD ATPase subunit